VIPFTPSVYETDSNLEDLAVAHCDALDEIAQIEPTAAAQAAY